MALGVDNMEAPVRQWAHAILGLAALGAGLAPGATAPAAAADLPLPPNPRRAATGGYSWTGVYVGGHGGFSRADFRSALAAASTASFSGQGAFVGGQAGVNVQIASWVLGVEAEASLNDITSSVSIGGGDFGEVRFDQTATLAGRLGYAFSRALIYGKFGRAWTSGEKWSFSILGDTSNGTAKRSGWVAGAGIEYAILSNWSARIEYNYSNMDDKAISLTSIGALFTTPAASDLKLHTVKLGLNYRFNWLPF